MTLEVSLLSSSAILALFDVGGGELFLLALIALLLYGGELPKVARKVGRIVGDLKRQADNITREWRELDYEDSRSLPSSRPGSRIPPPRQEPVEPPLPQPAPPPISAEAPKADEPKVPTPEGPTTAPDHDPSAPGPK